MINPIRYHSVNARKLKIRTLQNSFVCCSVSFICHIYACVCVCVCVCVSVCAQAIALFLRMERMLNL